MKKTISILVIICLLLGLTSSFAEDRTKNKKPRQRIELRKEEDRKEKIKGLKEEMRPYIDSATKDKKEIRRLVEKSKGSYKRAKGHIKKLLEEIPEVKPYPVIIVQMELEQPTESPKVIMEPLKGKNC